MLTRFISDSAWEAPEYVYPYDKDVSLNNNILYAAGNLNTNAANFLQNLEDISNNNYSLFYLTEKKDLTSLFDIKQPDILNLTKNYTCLLGVYAPNGQVVEDSLFLECQPLYNLDNPFKLIYATSNENVLGLSGRSAIFSSAFPRATGFELGFRVNSTPAVFNTTLEQRTLDVRNLNMRSAAHTVSSFLDNTFCEFVSGDFRNFPEKQTFKLVLSAKGGWDPSTFRGFGFGLGSTKLNTSYPYEKFFVMFSVNGFRQLPPASFSVDEIMTIPRLGTPNLPFFNAGTPVHSVFHSLTSLFIDSPLPVPPEDILEYDNGLYPLSGSFKIESASYDDKGISITISNKLSGSVTIYPYAWAPFGEAGNIFDISVTTEGYDAGFDLQFKPTSGRSEEPADLPLRYRSDNSKFKKPSKSNLGLDLYNFEIKETFKPDFYKLLGFNNNIFLDFNLINDQYVSITHTRFNKKVYLVCDDFLQKVYFLSDERINDSNIVLTYFNYVYDSANKAIIVYRMINERMFALSKVGDEVGLREVQNLRNIDSDSIFYILTFNDIEVNYQKNLWVGYGKTLFANDLTINQDVSKDVVNNFLYHAEYNNIKKHIPINIIPLKNQLNEFYNQTVNNDGVNFRDYHTIYTGDNREGGSYDVSLGYTTDTTEYVLKAGEITWFHLPYNEKFKRISLHQTNFVKNGAVYGLSPLFSDKIWKREGSYKYTSPLGDSNREQTGQWLCAWLSGSNDNDATWVDRYYNPEIITEVEAIKITNNLTYKPSYEAYGYAPGISDTKSRMTMEPGVWYAYNHVGKRDAQFVIDYLKKDLVQTGILNLAPAGIEEYIFNGNDAGIISLKSFKSPNNSFSLSFFGYNENWSQPFANQFIGNYLDTGFGVFNFKEINPLRFYYNLDKIEIYNNENKNILTIIQPPALSGNVAGIFRREFFENFHLVLDSYNILEYNLQGTLVDVVSSVNIVKKPIISTANNLNTGIILYEDLTYTSLDLKTNELTYVNDPTTATLVGFDRVPGSDIITACMDTFNAIYIVNGSQPLLREDKLYYLSNDSLRNLRVYNIVSKEDELYLDTTVLEVSATPQRVTAFYGNADQLISEFPYSSFNLKGLSGAGLSLYAPIPDLREYNLGFSIYKDPYLFYDTTLQTRVSALNEISNVDVFKTPISVDLHGNYWYKHTELEPPDEFNWEDFGQSGYISDNSIMFVGDPNWQERVGTSLSNYGRVFVYALSGNRLNPAVSFNKSPLEQRTLLTYRITNPADTRKFPLTAGFVFYQGFEILDASGFSNYNHLLTSFSLAFRTSASVAVHPTVYTTDNTRKAEVELSRLDSIDTLLHELSGWFNQPIFTYPGGAVALSSFYTFLPRIIDRSTFEIEVQHKYPGINLNSAGIPLWWGTINNTYGYTPFNTVVLQSGKNTTGKRDERFGAQVRSGRLSSNTQIVDDVVVISSPGWPTPLDAPEMGKIHVYKNVAYTDDANFNQTNIPFEIESPIASQSQRFGYTLAMSATQAFNGDTMATMIVGAPCSQLVFATSFVYLYDMPVNKLTIPLEDTTANIHLCAFAGPTAEGFGRKVDLSGDKFGFSRPLKSIGGVQRAGALSMYKYQRNLTTWVRLPGPPPVSGETPGREPYGLLSAYQVAELQNPSPVVDGQFGYDFSIYKDKLAVACLKSSVAGPGNLTCYVYSFTSISVPNLPDPAGIRTDYTNKPYMHDTYVLETVLTAKFLDRNITDLENMRVSVAIHDDHVALGGWYHDPSIEGGDVGKVAIWYRKHKDYYKMYDQPTTRVPDLTSKNYYGSFMHMVKDRIATGTMFIYNTGNSLWWAASAICQAINTQTDSTVGYEASPREVNDKSFFVTIASHLSSEVQKEAATYNVLNTDFNLRTFNEFVRAENYNGTSLRYSGNIIDYTFDLGENTIILVDFDKIKTYNAKGEFEQDNVIVHDNMPQLSCYKMSLENVLQGGQLHQSYSFYGVDTELHSYLLNYIPANKTLTYDKVDEVKNDYLIANRGLPQASNIVDYVRQVNYDPNNSRLIISNIRLKFPEPSISFKLRLNNRLDYEESEILSPTILTRDVGPGWHHFAVTFDSVAGLFTGYIDTQQVFSMGVVPNKYVFSNVLIDNLLVGSSPYFNSVKFDDFYQSKTASFYATNLKMEKVNFYNKALNTSEVKFLNFEKTPPNDLHAQIQFGERNYVDSISRVFRHKIPGKKSTAINIHISDSLITDMGLQKFYETKIIRELKEYLPSYVTINKIVWNASKPAAEKIIQGDINVGNTLTNMGGDE